ncbi:Crp/Fnr family transcriptional regulator [Heyndrickxia acidicola]|uniref:Crp/Fnr family transcriptional regulator n=1 Tax=Heyndrickxia acidicola TaxID=209389 RepID=A0ABU6MKH0_9BACI|nr:Crp/Fnr family transcriptional regulator [Heyndrickxia acidicola]MED1204486.1 Crp/Fnr family transcriptional regulator [Heyndrickxia acidicola]
MVTLYDQDFNWDSYLRFGTRQFFKKKERIYTQGTYGDGFYYLLKGIVRIVSTNTSGKERTLNIVIPGQLIGVQTLDQKEHFTTAIAITDSVVYHFSCEQMKGLIRVYPELFKLFSRTVIHKMKILLDRINLDALTSEQKVAWLLYTICYEFHSLEVPIHQQEIASCTGLTRITVYKIIKHWQEMGIVDVLHHKYHIKKPDFLRNLVR